MTLFVSKSRFRATALELFRQVERTGQAIIITHRGAPVLQLTPYRVHAASVLRVLRGSVVKYTAPTEPVGVGDWDAGA